MSIILQNSIEAAQAPYNNSPSKAHYSFSRAQRWKSKKPLSDAFYYDLPISRSTRSTSFGYGTRFEGLFPKPEQKPDPTAYQMSSSFSVDTKANAFTFGASRDAYRKVYVRGAKPRDPAIPGPGTYVIPKVTGLEGSRYTFRPKTAHLRKDQTPGPGTYPVNETFNGNGKQILSTHKASGGTLLGLTDGRFKKYGIERIQTPGPGKYSHMQFSGDGTYFISKFKSYVGQSIGHSKRPSIVTRSGIGTPGPGSYRAPSDFGQYGSKYTERRIRTEANSPRPQRPSMTNIHNSYSKDPNTFKQ